ncbi:hypothetical protein [Rhodopila sp.]|uniref:hypothetical protein n=1 Tax=Rhodopila sp. TaxID=2480087 RepID=UPI002D0E9145|nr:hypothetical protein [Rhodopila sp.]HVZ07740.1 hypothetical protein [Rhodopila sp.]
METADPTLYPRVAWDIDRPPLRPRLFLARKMTAEQISEIAVGGIETIAASYEFDDREGLNYSRKECCKLFAGEARVSLVNQRERIDLLASLMSDVAVKDDKTEPVDPTPLWMLFDQGHQHFLARRQSPCGHRPSRTHSRSGDASRTRPPLHHRWHVRSRWFSFAFPIWRGATTLTAVRALLCHPNLREPEGLKHPGVDHVVVVQRISLGKYMNFARARPI